MVTVHSLSKTPGSLGELFSLPLCAFDYRVGVVSPAQVTFALGRTDQELFAAFRFSHILNPHPNAPLGQSVEGLWEYDVAELFLLDAATGRYEEFNFAPSGAWWRCAFSAYRTRDNGVDCGTYQPRAWIGREDTASLIGVSISLSELSVPFAAQGGDPLSVCAILGAGADREYLSTSALDTKKPDFHRTDRFSSIRLVA